MADLKHVEQNSAVMIEVQVCYVTPQKNILQSLTVPSGATIQYAIESSRILATCSEIKIEECKVGVFGKIKSPDAVLHQGDRVEIYRPLTADPMEARRRRALKHAKRL